MARCFIGVDVGTGSARAGVFDATGRLLGTARHDIRLWREPGDIVEQSSADIWSSVCRAVREAMAASGVAVSDIAGIGFDATCSLVVLGPGGAPLSVGAGGHERDIIVWMDHRAVGEADDINATGHPVLAYVGGRISPEMETPKLLWLKRNKPDVFAAASQFFDLPDFLTWRATGSLARSTCTVTCKWTYLAHEDRWDAGYFRQIGLGELADEDFTRIGTEIVPPGTPLARGLTPAAAAELGLLPGVPVAAGMIDAHAGGVGTVGAAGGTGSVLTRMAYVFGTSACTMSSTVEPAFVPGIWGPYHSAMVPGLWLNEGGQSLAGAAIDHLVRFHPAWSEIEDGARREGTSPLDRLATRALAAAAHPSEAARLADGLHVVPDFLGNRSPKADPDARGVICGLGIDTSLETLIALYVAGVCALGYGVRQIVDAQAAKGISTEAIVISGGAGRSPLARHLLADSVGVPLAVPTSDEPVLLGSAMLGAVAAGAVPDLQTAMRTMASIETTVMPSEATRELHRRRYRVFGLLQAAERDSRRV